MLKRILVVDDDLASLKQVSAHLSGKYDLAMAKSGSSALRIISQERPDLVLLDVEMPEMDGFEVIRALRQDVTLNDIPVIFLTGDRGVETEIRALESGAMDFITKPVNKDILIHRIEIHLQISSYSNNLEQTVTELENGIAISFAEIIECKDHSSGGHLLRTSRYVGILGRALLEGGCFKKELTPEYVDMITRAMPFHDIGKIGISDVFLRKNSALTPEEYADVQRHTVLGGRIMGHLYERTPSRAYLKAAQIIAEGHHERYDGTGYPKGLRGEAIPLSCRIAAVVNVYDGCKTKRPYRKAMTHDDACLLVRQEAGRSFDPLVVEAFLASQDKFLGPDTDIQPLLNLEGIPR